MPKHQKNGAICKQASVSSTMSLIMWIGFPGFPRMLLKMGCESAWECAVRSERVISSCMDGLMFFAFLGEQLKIWWTQDKQHVGQLSLSYLQSHCYESESLRMKRDTVKLEKPVEVRRWCEPKTGCALLLQVMCWIPCHLSWDKQDKRGRQEKKK